MSEPIQSNSDQAPWFRQPIFWLLMSGPIIVVVAAFVSFGLAKTHAQEMVTDDYYKDGKHINLQLDRDYHAIERNIQAQMMFNPEQTAVKVFVSGKINAEDGLVLRLMHPALQAQDRIIPLKATSANEFVAQFDKIPHAVHWYVRLEDGKNVWRLEQKWLPSQGGVLMMKAHLPTSAASESQ